MLSCREVTRLVSLSQEKKLSFTERMQLKLHLWMCKRCNDFKTNTATIRAAMRSFADGRDEDQNPPK